MLILLFIIASSFCFSIEYKNAISEYLDTHTLSIFLKNIYYLDKQIIIDKDNFESDTNVLINSFYLVDKLSNIAIKYNYLDLKAQIKINFTYQIFDYQLIKEVGLYES